MQTVFRLRLAGAWNCNAKGIPGVHNTLADGVSRWPREMLADKVRELTHASDWREQSIGPQGSWIFYIVLQINILTKHDDVLWTLMMNEAEELA